MEGEIFLKRPNGTVQPLTESINLGRPDVGGDKRVSRVQATLVLSKKGQVKLQTNGVNPCVVVPKFTQDPVLIKTGERYTLQDGDSFTLISGGDSFFISIVQQQSDEDTIEEPLPELPSSAKKPFKDTKQRMESPQHQEKNTFKDTKQQLQQKSVVESPKVQPQAQKKSFKDLKQQLESPKPQEKKQLPKSPSFTEEPQQKKSFKDLKQNLLQKSSSFGGEGPVESKQQRFNDIKELEKAPSFIEEVPAPQPVTEVSMDASESERSDFTETFSPAKGLPAIIDDLEDAPQEIQSKSSKTFKQIKAEVFARKGKLLEPPGARLVNSKQQHGQKVQRDSQSDRTQSMSWDSQPEQKQSQPVQKPIQTEPKSSAPNTPSLSFKDLKRKFETDQQETQNKKRKIETTTSTPAAPEKEHNSDEEIGDFFFHSQKDKLSQSAKKETIKPFKMEIDFSEPEPASVPDDVDPYANVGKKSHKPAQNKPKKSGKYDWNSLKGFTIALTGTLSRKRADIIEIINDNGGTYSATVTKHCTHLVSSDAGKTTAKLDKARANGTLVVFEDDLLDGLKKKSEASPEDLGESAMEVEGKERQNGPPEEDDDDDDPSEKKGKAPKPLHHMNEGDTVPVQGSSNYEIRLRGGVYYCTCTAWKMQNLGTDVRTCKHLRTYLGDEFETWRCGRSDNAAAKVEKTTVPSLLLANKWEAQNPKGWWISEKLDGVRAYWDGKMFVSRAGNKFYAPDWFIQDLPKDQTLDGELFSGRGEFNSTVSIVKSQDGSKRWKTLTYNIFDIPSKKDEPFEDRINYLNKLFPKGKYPYYVVVEQTLCKDEDHLNEELKKVQDKKGEGLMLRKPKSKYVGSRSDTLLKVKTFEDAEAKVIGYTDGKGKHSGLVGALNCQLANGKTFSVGSGLSDKDRAKPPPIGSIITFRYQELTPAGIPRFPSYVGVRIDAIWPPKK